VLNPRDRVASLEFPDDIFWAGGSHTPMRAVITYSAPFGAGGRTPFTADNQCFGYTPDILLNMIFMLKLLQRICIKLKWYARRVKPMLCASAPSTRYKVGSVQALSYSIGLSIEPIGNNAQVKIVLCSNSHFGESKISESHIMDLSLCVQDQ
jgi:hypothetical protein